MEHSPDRLSWFGTVVSREPAEHVKRICTSPPPSMATAIRPWAMLRSCRGCTCSSLASKTLTRMNGALLRSLTRALWGETSGARQEDR
eukprot:15453708-Alexandrium_andersonii.AAC.1